MGRGRARRHGGREGPGERFPDRRVPGDREGRYRHGRRVARLDLGGNPMAVACGNAVLDVMLEPSFFERTQRLARLLQNKLEPLIGAYPKLFAELRGSGHLLGIRCQPALTAGDFVAKLRAEGLLCLTAGDNVLRILPPLVAGEREIEEGLGIMHKVAKEWPAS